MGCTPQSLLLATLLVPASTVWAEASNMVDPDVDFLLAESSAAEGSGALSVEVTLSAAAATDVSIPYSVGGSADSADVTVPAGPLVILQGQTSGSIDLDILDDADGEGLERVVLTLGTPTGAELGAVVEHTVLIDDDEPAATVSFDLDLQSVGEADGSFPVAVSLSSARTEEVQVSFSLSGAAAPGGVDYSVDPETTLVIPAGAVSGAVEVQLVADALDEPDEDGVLSLALPVNCDLGSITQHTFTILDDDLAPLVSFESPSSNLIEGGAPSVLVVALDVPSTLDVTVPVVASGVAKAGQDFAIRPPSVVIPAGDLQGSVTVFARDDAEVEGAEAFTLSLGTPTNADLGAVTTHDVQLIDDDIGATTVDFAAATSSFDEAAGTVEVLVQAGGLSAEPISVQLLPAGTASEGQDYDLLTRVITIPVGSLTATAQIQLLDDADVESDETIELSFGTIRDGIPGTQVSHVLTVTDDDGTPTIDFDLPASSHGEDAGQVTVTVSLSHPAPSDVTVPLVVGGTATLGGVDGDLLTDPLVIPAGSGSGEFIITLEPDALHEADETVLLEFGTLVGADAGSTVSHSLTVVDDDPEPVVQFLISRTVVAESSGGFDVTVVLDSPSGLDVTVPFTVTGDGSGVGDMSYPAGPLTIPAGDTEALLPVVLVKDRFPELGERALFTLETPTGATLGANSTLLVGIQDGDYGNQQALAPPLVPSADSLEFPTTRVGEESPVQLLHFTNVHFDPVTLTGLDRFGMHKGDFEITVPGGLPVVVDPGQSATVEITFRPNTIGERESQVRSSQLGQAAAPPRVDLKAVAYGRTGAEIQMNAGEAGVVTGQREYWAPEYGFADGDTTIFTDQVAGTSLEELYRTVRIGPGFSYGFELPNGAYEVVLLAYEPVHGAPALRVFDVAMEGQLMIDDLDLFVEVGHDTAWASEALTVEVIDGMLDIELTAEVDEAILSGLEIRSIPVLSVQPTDIQFGTVDQGTGATVEVDVQNDGLHTGLLDGLAFQLSGQGSSADFSVNIGGETYTGDVQSIGYSPSIPLPPGITTIPLTFTPTEHQDHEFTLELESTGTGDLFEVAIRGTGGAQAGWGFLHPVLDPRPEFVVDYDQDGIELVELIGTSSHTHEPGHLLISHEWDVDGQVVASSISTSHVFSTGTSAVTLTIGDDNVPQDTAADSIAVTVHPVDAVPGALVRYYDGSVADELTLLDAVPARPDHTGRGSGLHVNESDGAVGDSPFSANVMVTMVGSFELSADRTLEFQALGGADHRIYVDGVIPMGPVLLAAGVHELEVRFAVTTLADLPASLSILEGGMHALDVEALIQHDERNVQPVIHSMPTVGTELGGNRIELSGFGFFPETGTVVHWGTTPIPSTQFDDWSGESITLTTPPGSGTISVYVETPQGISNTFDFSYSPSGPIPIRFDLLTDRELLLPDVTSATWGPDGRLYVAQLTGEIHAITYDGDYSVVSVEAKAGVSGLTNHDTLSVGFSPFDIYDPLDPTSLKLYVGHGEQFQNGGGAFTGPSYFTGQVSLLTGPDFDAPVPVVTQLPVSNHDHSIDGMSFDENGDLLLSVGGNTNAGVRWPLLGDLPESPLSGAILRIRLSDSSFNGSIVYEDSASSVLVDDQVLGEAVDVATDVDVEVYAPGVRHAYDLVLHTNGYVYATDNGPNAGYGPASTGLSTDAGPVHPYEDDELNLVEPGVYLGSANRNRGRYDERQLMYRGPQEPNEPGVYRRPLTSLASSTNGIDEYRATAFNSAMRGDLLAMKWNFGVYRIELREDGRSVTGKTLYQDTSNQAHLPNKGLDLVTGPGGAVVAIDYSYGKVRVQVPNDLAAMGLTAYDIFPWRAPAGGGQPFVIGGAGFGTDLAQVNVTIGGVPATLTSVTDSRIHGVYPPSATGLDTEMLDVEVTVGAASRVISEAARYLPPAPGQGRGRWRDGSILPLSLGEVSSTTEGGILYVFGEGDARTFSHSLLSGGWSLGLTPRPLPGRLHAVEVLDGKIYLIGGIGGGSAGQVQIYDIAADSWSLGAPMPWNAGSCVSALIDGLVYVGGGVLEGAGTAGNFAVYDPAADTWTSLGAMPTAVHDAASGTDGEKLYVFGGHQGQDVSQPGFSTVQVYDPVAATWLSSELGEVAAMPLPRGGTGRAVFTQGEFYVMGGEDDLTTFSEVQVYSHRTDSWRTDRPLPTARHGIDPVLFEGRIFVLGGSSSPGVGASGTSEILSPR